MFMLTAKKNIKFVSKIISSLVDKPLANGLELTIKLHISATTSIAHHVSNMMRVTRERLCSQFFVKSH